MYQVKELYEIISGYANANDLEDTKKVIPLVGELVGNEGFEEALKLGFSACKMLIDLRLLLSKKDMDKVLSAELMHAILMTNASGIMLPQREIEGEILRRIWLGGQNAKLPLETYFLNIRDNKLATIIKLAEMSVEAEQLVYADFLMIETSIQNARKYLFPLCIYTKEFYPDLAMPASVLMEKIRLLIAVADILSTRHRERETAFFVEMIGLEEQNARMRVSIEEMQSGKL